MKARERKTRQPVGEVRRGDLARLVGGLHKEGERPAYRPTVESNGLADRSSSARAEWWIWAHPWLALHAYLFYFFSF
jgi:hypothetical protein